MADPTHAPLVTLLTDFGEIDPYVGIMKGVLYSRCPGLRAVVDLTHGVPAQDVRAAAFYLRHAWSWFPEGTVHVAVVDPGVGSGRPILAARRAGHRFLAPDNGLLAPLLAEDPDSCEVRVLDVERFALPGTSRTFHGRDVFSPAAAALAAGLAFEETGELAARWEGLELAPARDGAGEVVLVDRFGNLITNLERDLLGAPETGARGPVDSRGDGPAWAVEIAGRSVPLRRTYAEAGGGELLALVDSYGLIEVARRDGSAAEVLGVGPGTPATLRRSP